VNTLACSQVLRLALDSEARIKTDNAVRCMAQSQAPSEDDLGEAGYCQSL